MTRRSPNGSTRTANRQSGQAPSTGAPKTARTGRRLLKTGTVGDILALLPPSATTPANGPDLPVLDPTAGDDLPRPTLDKVRQHIPDRDVENTRAFIRASGIVPHIEGLLAQVKAATPNTRPGRPSRVPIEALLVAMWLAASTHRPMLLTEFRDILFHGLTPAMRNILGVSDGVTPRGRTHKQKARWDKSAVDAVRNTFKTLTSVLDPSDEIVQRKLVQWDDMRYRGLSDQEMQAFHANLDWVCNQLLLVAYNTLPAKVRRKDTGDRCIDASPLKVFARQRGLDDTEAMSMPWAANYVRDEDHLDPDEKTDPKPARRGPLEPRTNRFRRKRAESYPALDLHTLVTSETSDPDRQYMPSLFGAMTTDRAALDPAGAARRTIAAHLNNGFTTGFLTGDMLYARAEASTFQKPAREAGFRLILPIPKGHSGVQGSHESGFPWVDGTGHCPAIPEHLRDAINDYRNKRINHETFVKRIQARKKFELKTKQNSDINGVGERLGCGAADHSLSVRCALKPNSLNPPTRKNKDGEHVLIAGPDLRPEITLPESQMTNGLPPTICQKQWVTIKPDDAAKDRQAIPVGDKHTDIYNRLRQSQEGGHGFAKDEAKEAIGTPGRRRVKTKVAQQLFVAFLLAAANLRKIRSFLAKATEDRNGDLYIDRPKRTGDHSRTGNPPGAPPPDRDEAT